MLACYDGIERDILRWAEEVNVWLGHAEVGVGVEGIAEVHRRRDDG